MVGMERILQNKEPQLFWKNIQGLIASGKYGKNPDFTKAWNFYIVIRKKKIRQQMIENKIRIKDLITEWNGFVFNLKQKIIRKNSIN